MPLPPTFPPLSSLDVFVSAVRLGSVSRAAAAHGISQPTASARIQNLERQLGIRLLNRGTGGSTPTQGGYLVAEWASTILEDSNNLMAGLEALRTKSEDKLRLAASLTIAEYLLPGWLAHFQTRHPGASAALEVTNSSKVIESVENGNVDLGFIESPGSAHGLDSIEVGCDELVLVVASTHPLAKRKNPLPCSDLKKVNLILREPGSGTRESLEAALEECNSSIPQPLLELGSNSAIKAAILDGAGAAVLSKLAVEIEIRDGRLSMVPLKGPMLKRHLRAIWLANNPLSELASSLLAQIKL